MRSRDIDRSGSIWRYVPRQHKGLWRGKPRTVFLGSRARAVLSPWLRQDPEAFLLRPEEVERRRQQERRLGRRTPLTPSQKARPRKAALAKHPGDRDTSRVYCRAVA